MNEHNCVCVCVCVCVCYSSIFSVFPWQPATPSITYSTQPTHRLLPLRLLAPPTPVTDSQDRHAHPARTPPLPAPQLTHIQLYNPLSQLNLSFHIILSASNQNLEGNILLTSWELEAWKPLLRKQNNVFMNSNSLTDGWWVLYHCLCSLS